MGWHLDRTCGERPRASRSNQIPRVRPTLHYADIILWKMNLVLRRGSPRGDRNVRWGVGPSYKPNSEDACGYPTAQTVNRCALGTLRLPRALLPLIARREVELGA